MSGITDFDENKKIKEFLLLKIRNLICNKELLVSEANCDLQKFGFWQCNYTEVFKLINDELDILFKELEAKQ